MNNSFCMNAAYFLKTSDKNLGGETVASVVFTGIAVVFVALILLIALVWCYGKIFETVNAKAAAKAEAELAKKAEAAPKTAEVAVKAAPAPVVEDGIEEEIVAVISAAIAAYGAQTGKKLAVRSIKASGGAPSGRNAWSAAGLAEATRPF
ncbi:sodium pump decarboxylases, gamma subunit [Ruminococcus sp. YE71]|uniref:OadG family transporter subunit n=1 Tax=unclassified Ruminococcus TaxID=2608920 RepID=UPI0008855C91|nr:MULTISPECIES: OadG family transporter subunit [unclassified Ruminococcus]SDA23942.1 sodium pump decarboxylases, gamma subunit [Ruminococcus sp. YE78]SFW40748.1 sodium pump decarboxylases, gamma subunit [Ruminococcus sp. YE71]